MSDARNPKAGGLWARLFNLDAEPEEAAAQANGAAPVETPAVQNLSLDDDQIVVPPTVPDLDLDAPPPVPKAVPAVAVVAALPAVASAPPPISAPVGPRPCPSCGTVCKADAKFCDDCGWMFAGDAGLALPSSPTPSILTLRAIAMPNSPSVRLQGRYEIGALTNERLGISRYRGIDHGDGVPKPITIVALALAPVAEVLVDEEPVAVADVADDEMILPDFDTEVPVAAAVTTEIPASHAPWPSVAWERDLLSKALCPSLPTPLDYFIEDNVEYLIESLPEGRVLWDAWDDPEANADIRYGWLQHVAEGLQALHAAGAVLEGVRPDLVTVTQSGQAIIGDLSDLLPVPMPADPPIRATLYTAPELVLAPESVDARSDLYSIGAMLYSLEYLHHALEEKDFERQFVPTQITERFPDVHPLFLRLINKTFCRDLNTRFPTDEAGKKDPTGFSELIDTIKVCRRSFDNVRFDMAAWTTTGMVRTGNEDALAFLHGVESRQDDLHEYALIILCDGMGGYEAGEVAAALAISELRKYLLQQPMFAALSGKEAPTPPSPPSQGGATNSSPPSQGGAAGGVDVEAIRKVLEAALKHANKEVHTAGRTPGRGKRGMGCTAEAVYIDSRNVIVGHVGDSRTYHLRRGRLQQLTRDQTLVNRLVELGQLSAADAENHPRKNELQQAIGGQPDVAPGTYSSKLSRGDWILVCSDGLTNHISNQELEKMLTREAAYSAEEAARRLLNLVNLRGATDNATIVVVRAS